MNELCGMAIANLKLSKEEFYSLTPIELYYAFNSYYKEKEINQRFASENMRLQTAYLVSYLSMNEITFNSLNELMPFDWDKKTEEIDRIGYTPEDWEELDKIYCDKKEAL